IEKVKTEVDSDAEWAEAQADPDSKDGSKNVYFNLNPQNVPELNPGDGEKIVLVDAINHALDEELAHNDKMMIYGQDVAGGKGGVFTATRGLTDKHGADRVFNSPLAESSIIGTAIGLATLGYKPVVEIQFGDYIWYSMMQIRNEVATMRYRSNGKWSCPIVMRVPVGGYIHGSICHSQSIDGFFTHLPGIYIAYPSNASDAKGLLKMACRMEDPVMFMEHKGLYRQGFAASPEPDENYLLPFGKARIVQEGNDVTIITWGALVQKSIEAARNTGLSVEIIDLRQLCQLFRVVTVMGQPVVRVWHPQVRVGSSTQLATEHEGEDAGDVGLIGEREQVEHQLDVLLVGVGHADRTSQLGKLGVGTLGLSQLDPALERADRVEILGDSRAIARTDVALEIGEVVGHRIENAAVPPHLGHTLLCGTALAEQTLEHDPRVVLHRLRCRGRTPRDRVQVDTAVPVFAVAHQPVEIDRELQRRQRGLSAQFLRGNLVGGDPGPYVRPLGLVRMHAVQPGGAGPRMLAVPITERLCLTMRQAAHDHQLVAERSERAQNGRQSEPGPDLGRCPLLHDGAVRNVDEPEPPHRGGGGGRLRQGRQRRHHRVEER
ncbi:MAG TPA: hypothetical protein EYO97_05075, partial [Gemmatimonadetes bacterium]|nr:hypothetical protein [Gemmatimonadota bacterium]